MADPHIDSLLARLRESVTEARAMPMSASAVVNRGDLLGLLDELDAAVASAFRDAEHVLADREAVVAEGRTEADRLVADAREERQRLLSDTDVAQGAHEQADSALAEARQQAEEVRREADVYVDAKLAHFEITLHRTMEAVKQGRARLAGEHSDFAALRPADPDEQPLPDHLTD